MVETIAVVGGTGNLGAAIARRLAKAGHPVIIGSRSAESAERAAAELGFGLTGQSNAEAAQAADIVIITVPFAAQDATLADIAPYCAGKIVVDTTVPLVPPKVMRVQLPAEGSAAQRTQDRLGEGVTVVSAFHNVAAHKLATDLDVDCDVLVFGDDKSAREKIVQLSEAMDLRAFHAGALCNSAAAEALTSILIFINKNYDVGNAAGIRLTGPSS
ncbi:MULTISPECIES: NADPH-dependent F420 reductase [Sphingobium]|uniref:NADPH-dependent F420 reductase n=1 Tax=Sphingobium TaxID=165695 RepID=UPI00159C642A|nr:NADPH-dependent F420 reductase [Sphingobium sp. 15-1]